MAQAEFNALNTESLDLKTLSDALSGMVSGRHIMVWSANPATQATWETNGVAGTLSSDSTLVALINRGGNKPDPYIHVTCTLQVDHQGSSGTTGTLTVKMVNTTPPGQGYIGRALPGTGHRVRGVSGVPGGEPAGGGSEPEVDAGADGGGARRGRDRLGCWRRRST